jgi:hypothetical protein
MHRFYTLSLQRDLLDSTMIDKEWGRPGTVRPETSSDEIAARAGLAVRNDKLDAPPSLAFVELPSVRIFLRSIQATA